jgi:hypothetical protein
VPGIDLTKLTADQKGAFKKKLESLHCTCGCNRNLLDCRLNDRSCSVSKKLAKDQLEAFLSGKGAGSDSAPTAAPVPKDKDTGDATPTVQPTGK